MKVLVAGERYWFIYREDDVNLEKVLVTTERFGSLRLRMFEVFCRYWLLIKELDI